MENEIKFSKLLVELLKTTKFNFVLLICKQLRLFKSSQISLRFLRVPKQALISLV
jgi:hypothetical protein